MSTGGVLKKSIKLLAIRGNLTCVFSPLKLPALELLLNKEEPEDDREGVEGDDGEDLSNLDVRSLPRPGAETFRTTGRNPSPVSGMVED
jgi:hypothetical protein